MSNGVPLFRKPATVLAQRTLTFIVVILVGLLGGIAYLVRVYGIGATEPGSLGYQSVLSLLVGAVMGRGTFYYIILTSVVAVLCLSANTSFADFPRLCRVLADDRFLPDAFAVRGRRLVFSYGVVVLTLLAAVLLLAFGGITDRLIPLFAVGAFLAFTVSQVGMVVHWRRLGGRSARHSLPLNATGALATGVTLVVVIVSKFTEGAWLTILVVPALVGFFLWVNRHYRHVAAEIVLTSPLDTASPPVPLVVVPVQSWNKLSERGLRFAIGLSPDVYVLQVITESGKAPPLTAQWDTLVGVPSRSTHRPTPALVVLQSKYRQVFTPLIDYVLQLRNENPGRDVVVVIPDLVVHRWYHAIFHNNRGHILRGLLRLRGDARVIVINTPFYLRG